MHMLYPATFSVQDESGCTGAAYTPLAYSSLMIMSLSLTALCVGMILDALFVQPCF
jgi:hypothetical protein